jgi:hypothetical protein
MFSKKKILICFFILQSLLSTHAMSFSLFSKGKVSFKDYPTIINKLVTNDLEYSAIPWAKEYLVSGKRMNKRFEQALENLIDKVGIKHFETIPRKFLKNSSSSYIKYVYAKKLFRRSKKVKSLKVLNGIRATHRIYPFALHLMGTLLSALKKNTLAMESFKDCVSFSKKYIEKYSGHQKYLYQMNRDYCVVGKARVTYAQKDFKEAKSLYLDLPKSSRVWPEILFEEAWNSFYLGNYNRTLGKLVTYKAPVFDFNFNPEIEVLSAYTYYKLCLFSDANKVAKGFFKKYHSSAKRLRNNLLKRGKDYLYFYKKMLNFESNPRNNKNLMGQLLKNISTKSAYNEIRSHLLKASKEFRLIKVMNKGTTRRVLISNIIDVIKSYKKILGSYVRSQLVGHYADLYRAFQSMSYIKLEILAKQKEKLYSFKDAVSGKRGDVKFIDRNDKQYFWDFNGEFWADELGDYVFALGSEC